MSLDRFIGVFPDEVAMAVASRSPAVRLGSRDMQGLRRVFCPEQLRMQVLMQLSAPQKEASDTRFVTAEQLTKDALALVPRVPASVDAIIGVSRSGLTPAGLLAMQLHLPLYVLRQSEGDVVPAGHGFRLSESNPRHALVVDDTSMTGRSLQDVISTVRKSDLFGDITTATVYCAPTSKCMPDLWSRTLPYPHFLEWNLFNSVFSPETACDFDGVLCEDCPADCDDDGERYLNWMQEVGLKYAPRRTDIPLAVTARLERYRSVTESWLASHGVRVQSLQMHPAASLAERNRQYSADWKADLFHKWASQRGRHTGLPAIFVESCPQQSAVIAHSLMAATSRTGPLPYHTGCYVICPSAARVWSV